MSTDIRHRKQVGEATPLLSSSSRPDGSVSSHHSDASHTSSISISWQKRKILGLLFLLLFFIDFPALTRAAPKMRLMELTICREYYRRVDPSVVAPDGNVPEMMCKLPQIQSELAEVRGVSGMLDGIPGLLLAVPYGIMSDSKGRRIIAFLGILGNVLEEIWFYIVLTFYDTFSIKAVYGGATIMFLGGGSVVLSASVTAMIADVAPENMRTRIFFYANVATFVSELIAPPLSSLLMERFGSSQTYFTTLPWDLITFVILFILPETLKMKDRESEILDSPLERRRSESPIDNSLIRPSNRLTRYNSWIAEKYSTTKEHIVSDVMPLIRRREILLGIAALVVAVFSRPVSEILLQYMSARFQWKLSKAAFLLSYQAALRMLSFSALFPIAHYLLNRRLRATETTDLTFGIWSSCITVIGLVGMGISSSWVGVILAIVPFTLGGGVAAASKSFVTSQVSREHIGLLYTTCAVFEGIVALLAPAALALALSTGLKLGGFFQGAPFYLVALLYVGAGTCLWFIPANYKRTVFHIDVDDDDNDPA